MWQIVISCSQLRSSINGGTQSCNFLPATSSIRLQQGQLVGRLTLATLPAEVRHSGIVSNETPLILILILAPLCDPSLLTLFIPPLRRSSSIGYISVILIDSSSTLSDSIHQLSLNFTRVHSISRLRCGRSKSDRAHRREWSETGLGRTSQAIIQGINQIDRCPTRIW